MTLLCLIVVLASAIYIFLISKKYTDYVQITRPYIDEVTEKNERLAEDIETEKEARRTVVSQVKDEEMAIGDLKITIENVEAEIAEERAVEEKIELSKQMKQFTKRKS